MKQNYQIMLPITQVDRAEVLLPLAAAWLHQVLSTTKDAKGEIIFIGAVTVPENQSLSVGAQSAQALRTAMHSIRTRYPDLPLRVKSTVPVSYAPWQEVLQAIEAEQPELIMFDWDGDPAASIMGVPLADILSETPCELALVRPTAWDKIERILLPIRGGPYTKLAVDFSLAIAEMTNAEITVMHASSRGDLVQPYASYRPLLRNIERIKRQLTIVGDVVDEVLIEAGQHELIVMGASSRPGKTGPEPLGPIASQIAMMSSIGLVLLKSPRAFMPMTPRLYSVPSSVPVLVDKWFAENTFDASEFDDIDRLIDLKTERGVSISLALPALNEEETVGKVIRTLRNALMKKHPLLRAIRIDKLTLAALEGTLRLYRDERQALAEIPTLRMLTASASELSRKAKTLVRSLRRAIAPTVKLSLAAGFSQAGGGALPLLELPTTLITVTAEGMSPQAIEATLRGCPVPVIGRIFKGTFLLDPRTIQNDDIPALVAALQTLAGQ